MGTVTFQNTDTMLRMSSSNPVGTIAFILDEEALLVRVNKGWQYIALGTLVPLATQPMTTTSVSPSYGPDLQASNLLNSNSILKSPESYTVRLKKFYFSRETWLGGMEIACHRRWALHLTFIHRNVSPRPGLIKVIKRTARGERLWMKIPPSSIGFTLSY